MSPTSTLGMLYIDGYFACYTLEDAVRDEKIPGKTCIPTGRYGITLRSEGGQNHRYGQKFPSIHRGMLQLIDVPDFDFIYIHLGNTTKDIDACILVGDGVSNNIMEEGFLSSSAKAYQRIYTLIVDVMETGEGVWIEIMEGISLSQNQIMLVNEAAH